MPYCFFGSSIKFQGHKGWKIDDLNPIWVRLPGRSQLSNPSDLPCSRSSIKFQGHMGWKIDNFNSIWVTLLGWSQLPNPSDLPCFRLYDKFQGHTGQKIGNFDPNWAFLDCNSSLNSPMALKWCSKVDVVQRRCAIVFWSHPSNLKVTWDKKITNFDLSWEFPDCNSSLNSPMDFKRCTKLDVL